MTTQLPIESTTLPEAKLLVIAACELLDLPAPVWRDVSGISPWESCEIGQDCSLSFAVSVSSGGVASVDRSPFNKRENKINNTLSRVLESMTLRLASMR